MNIYNALYNSRLTRITIFRQHGAGKLFQTLGPTTTMGLLEISPDNCNLTPTLVSGGWLLSWGHLRDCQALLVTSLTHVSGAITSAQTFTFNFTFIVRVPTK